MKACSRQIISKEIFKEHEAYFIRELWGSIFDIENFIEELKERGFFKEDEYDLDGDEFIQEGNNTTISIDLVMFSPKEFRSILESVYHIKKYDTGLYYELLKKLINYEK